MTHPRETTTVPPVYSAESYNPGADAPVYSLAVQADGKILVGGDFTVLGGQSHEHLGRLKPEDGSLDTTFTAWSDGSIRAMALVNNKIVVGGSFTTLAGQGPYNNIALLNSTDGSVDTSFNPGADGPVVALTVQPDGKILTGGSFTTLGGQPHDNIGRLNTDGSVDPSFAPMVNGFVNVVEMQPDGKILIGGDFNSVCGQPRANIARLNSSGGCVSDPDVPIVDDEASFEVSTDMCANGTNATFDITVQGTGEHYPPTSSDWSNTLTETPAGSGHYVGTVPPLQQFGMKGEAALQFHVDCGGSPNITSKTLFIDPSGWITDTQGNPIAGANVTLLYTPSGSQSGPFQAVPDQNTGLSTPIMSDDNKTNPITTNNDGYYRWDVVPGWYKVRAEKAGCSAAVESAAIQLVAGGLAVTNINLILDCSGSGLSVQITPQSDWQTGYCRNVIVTNNSTKPVDWKTSFSLNNQGGGTVNQFWNTVWSQNGDLVTFEGVSWNNTLQPGQSTHSLGFCANR